VEQMTGNALDPLDPSFIARLRERTTLRVGAR
jgi:hypothetical protein